MKRMLVLLLHPFFLLLSVSQLNGQELKLSKSGQLLDFDWKFALGNLSNAQAISYDDGNWRKLDLPHDWSIEGHIDRKNPTGNDGGYFPAGIGWYRKKLNVPASWDGKSISIYCEGVYMNSEVFVNGKLVGKRPYGYSSFWYNISSELRYGQENVIAVRVDNSQQKNCRWYSGSGIYRHVRLFTKNPVQVDNWGVQISTPQVNDQCATVHVKTLIKNETAAPQRVLVTTILSGNKNNNVGKANQTITIPAQSQKEVLQVLRVNKPALWSPDRPSLYKAHITLSGSNQTHDAVDQEFGIRTIQFSTTKGFQLNGKTLKLNGGCVHHDNGLLGAAAYDRAEERKVELLKAAGFNAVRTAHNLPSEAFLNACDRLGMLVMDEAFDGWREKKNTYDYSILFDNWWQKDIESMVLRDRNHPSIFMWSSGNEIIERKKPEAVETAKMLANYIKKLDGTRPVTSAMTTWDKDWEIFDPLFAVHDVGGYNYQLHRAAADHKRVPSRIMVQTESYPRDAFANWQLVNENSYIIGDFVWTAMDYLGESGIGRYFYPDEPKGEHYEADLFPWHGAYCGDIDLTGWRKPISHYRNLLWNDNEKLYMAVKEPNPETGKIRETIWSVWPTWESWTWPGMEGREIEVEVYSKYPSVKLFLNNKLIEEKKTSIKEQHKAIFKIPYAAGILKAVGIENGKEADEVFLKTSDDAKAIKLTADRHSIKANGQDLCYITIEIIDKKGLLQPNSENELHFKIEGPGTILGIGSANLKDTDPYVGVKRKAWKGRALLVIKSNKDVGNIVLNVNSPGLTSTKTIIRSVM